MDERNLELSSMSVYDFLNQASDLLEQDEQADFVRFVLTGRHEDKQAVVDAILNALPNDESISATRDYDSLLGIDKKIHVKGALTVYPASKSEDVLCKNIHVRHGFTNSRDRVSYSFSASASTTNAGLLGTLLNSSS